MRTTHKAPKFVILLYSTKHIKKAMITLIKRILEEIQHWLLPIFILLVFGGLLLCAVWGIVEPGNYSEMLQALFALLGTIGLLYTLELQRKTLKSQQEQFAEQAKTQRKEDVKNRFFKMLDYHNQIVSQLSVVDTEGKEYKGREVFIHLQKVHQKVYSELKSKNGEDIDNLLTFNNEGEEDIKRYYYKGISDEERIELLKKHLQSIGIQLYNNKNTYPITAYTIIYQGFHQEKDFLKVMKGDGTYLGDITLKRKEGSYYNTHLSVYFRNLYNAVKLVHLNKDLKEHEDKTKCEKYQLVSILRAQLSNPEIYMLFFNILSQYGEKWSSSGFVDKYHFIKNISKVDLDLVGIDPRDYFKDIDYENYPPKN